MIGEDGAHDRRGAASAFAGMEVDEARAAVVAALREEGLDLRHPAVRPRRAALAPLRAADRAAHLAPVVLRHERARQAGDRGRARRAAALPPRAAVDRRSTSTGSRTSGPGASRASSGGATSSRSGTAATRPTSATEPPEGEGWERDPDVLDTWFSSGAVAVRDARLARGDARAARPSTRPTCSRPARDIIFLWVARMVMFGHRVHRRAAVHRRPDPLGHPGARRPADVEVARHRDRPARPDRRATAPTRCASGCWRCPRRRTCASTRSASSRARDLANKLWNASRLVLLRVRGRAEPDAARPRRSRTAGSSRGSSALTASVTELLDGVPTSRAAALELYEVFWSRALRLVPRARQAAALRRGQRRASSGGAAARARADADAAAPGHAVRDRGDLVASCPASAGCWPCAPWPEAGRGAASTTRPRRRSERVIEAVTALRRYRDDVGRQAGARRSRRGSRPTATTTARPRRAAGALRVRRTDATDGDVLATVPIPGGAVQVLAVRRVRPRGGRAALAARARAAPRRDRARRAQARQQGLRREGAARGGGGRARQARRVPRRARAPRTTMTFRAGRGVPARARAVRHAVRARPHAQADDRARHAAAAVRARSTWSARTASRRRSASPRRSSSATGCAPAATPRRTCARSAERIEVGEEPVSEADFAAAVSARRPRRRAREPDAPSRRRGHPVRGADRRGLPRARRGAGWRWR